MSKLAGMVEQTAIRGHFVDGIIPIKGTPYSMERQVVQVLNSLSVGPGISEDRRYNVLIMGLSDPRIEWALQSPFQLWDTQHQGTHHLCLIGI